MSQPEADLVQVDLRPGQLVNAITSCVQRHDHVLQNCGTAKDRLVEAPDLHNCEGMENDPAHISALRAELLKLVEIEREVAAHKRALQELRQNYQPSLTRSDFGTQLEEAVRRDLEANSFNPATCEAVKEFDGNAGLEAEGEDEEELDEDGLVVVGGGNQNSHCPISGKDVMSLTDPVEDLKGYIYSKEAIIAFFRGNQRIRCPVAGCNHHITVDELKPAKKILKAQRRARQAGPSQATQRAAELVLEA